MPRPPEVWTGSTGVQCFQPLCSSLGLPVQNALPTGVQHDPTFSGLSNGGAHWVSASVQHVRVHVPLGSSGSLYPFPVETVKLSAPGSEGAVPFHSREADSGGFRLTVILVM